MTDIKPFRLFRPFDLNNVSNLYPLQLDNLDLSITINDLSFSTSFHFFATQNTPQKTSPGKGLQSVIALSS